MHLLVPGAYRLGSLDLDEDRGSGLNAPSGAGCLPTVGECIGHLPSAGSQCTFWCRVLSDLNSARSYLSSGIVSMHLLVPGAYRLGGSDL